MSEEKKRERNKQKKKLAGILYIIISSELHLNYYENNMFCFTFVSVRRNLSFCVSRALHGLFCVCVCCVLVKNYGVIMTLQHCVCLHDVVQGKLDYLSRLTDA